MRACLVLWFVLLIGNNLTLAQTNEPAFPQVDIHTDKPAYQPGQTVHIRGHLKDAKGNPITGESVVIRLYQEEYGDLSKVMFEREVPLSAFGVATADWQIPNDIKTGNYGVVIKLQQMSEARFRENLIHNYRWPRIKITHYDYPELSVTVEPDRRYYLPGQTAHVLVKATTLQGKALMGGQVRVTRKRDSSDGVPWEETGETGAEKTNPDGICQIALDLTDAFADRWYEWDRIHDLPCLAVVTDPATNWTAETAFTLRVAKEAIQVFYLQQKVFTGEEFEPLPLRNYVITLYPDGTPAECAITIQQKVAEDSNLEVPERFLDRPDLVFHTNRYGVGEVVFRPEQLSQGQTGFGFHLTARDATGNSGTKEAGTGASKDKNVLELDTDKALYRAGEPIQVRVTARKVANGNVQVCAIDSEGRSRLAQAVLQNGSATVILHETKGLSGEVLVGTKVTGTAQCLEAVRRVLFPKSDSLRVKLTASQHEYLPGELVQTSIQVTDSDGNPVTATCTLKATNAAIGENQIRLRNGSLTSDGFSDAANLESHLQSGVDVWAGISGKDLTQWNMRQPVSDDLQLLAAIWLGLELSWVPATYLEALKAVSTESDIPDGKEAMEELDHLKYHLEEMYNRLESFPETPAALAETGMLQAQPDPWKTPLRSKFTKIPNFIRLELISAGPDGRFGTPDDVICFSRQQNIFQSIKDRIEKAISSLQSDTGELPGTTTGELKRLLRTKGIDCERLRDGWGTPVKFEFATDPERSEVYLVATSAGPNRRFESPDTASDDVTVWRNHLPYFNPAHGSLSQILERCKKEHGRWPANETEWQQVLKTGNVSPKDLVDRWGNQVVLRFDMLSLRTIHADSTTLWDGTTELKPNLRGPELETETVRVRAYSWGPDGKQGTQDDLEIFSDIGFGLVGLKATSRPALDVPAKPGKSLGQICGTVRDTTGRPIASASVSYRVQMEGQHSEKREFVSTQSDGAFCFGPLLPGLYHVEVATGNGYGQLYEVPVISNGITRADFSINQTGAIGGSTDCVEITEEGTFRKFLSQVANTRHPVAITGPVSFREETALWNPEILTDRNGQAVLSAPMGKSSTLWNFSVIATTRDGRTGTGHLTVRTRQPFEIAGRFPGHLSVGDEVTIPFDLTNLTETSQTLTFTLQAPPEIKVVTPVQGNRTIQPGQTEQVFFTLQAEKAVSGAVLHLNVTGSGFTGDIKQAEVVVHELSNPVQTQTVERYFNDQVEFEVVQPDSSRPGKTELTLYPSAVPLAFQGIEQAFRIPSSHQNTAQLVSAGAGNLAIWRMLVLLGVPLTDGKQVPLLGSRQCLDLLKAIQLPDGSFGYADASGTIISDEPLTARALAFMQSAEGVIPVDPVLLEKTRHWLAGRKQAVLTRARELRPDATDTELREALDVWRLNFDRQNSSAELISLAEAADRLGDRELYRKALEKLVTQAQLRSQTMYWQEHPFSFSGDGDWFPGCLTTTARAIHLLSKQPEYRETVRKALLFVISGIQQFDTECDTSLGTNVIGTIGSMLKPLMQTSAGPSKIEILVNGHIVKTLTCTSATPITLDLAEFLTKPANRVEIRCDQKGLFPSACMVRTAPYLFWSSPDLPGFNRSTREKAIWLKAGFDKIQAKIGEPITCRVEIGCNRHYRFLPTTDRIVAEISLPPGAVVNRGAFEQNLAAAGWRIRKVDVQSGAVTVEGDSRSERVQFMFNFSVPYPIRAQAPPTVVYSVGDPQTRATLPPVRFEIK